MLDRYSRRVADILFAERPDWRSYATFKRDSDQKLRFLQIEFPTPPKADLLDPLYISTWNSEITVGMDIMHSHIMGEETAEFLVASGLDPEALALLDSDEDFERGCAYVIAFVEEFISEDTIVASAWKGKSWKSSWYVTRDDMMSGAAQREAIVRAESSPIWPDSPNRTPPVDKALDRYRIRSWKGTFDLDLDAFGNRVQLPSPSD
jgi:hypothetical protein